MCPVFFINPICLTLCDIMTRDGDFMKEGLCFMATFMAVKLQKNKKMLSVWVFTRSYGNFLIVFGVSIFYGDFMGYCCCKTNKFQISIY